MENCFFSKYNSYNLAGATDQTLNDQFKNLNLNQNYKKSFSTFDNKNLTKNDENKKRSNFALNKLSDIVIDKSETKTQKSFWNKNDSKSYSTSYLNLIKDAFDKEIFEEEKMHSEDDANRSTLSLYIAAYENSNEVSNEALNVLNGLNEDKKNPFEFPRQQESQKSKPEVAQFKASQKLLLPNLSAEMRNAGSLGLKRQRRKPKRNADPIGFQEWQATDREFWRFVTKILRNWKATERQCSATRRPITFFQDIKYKVKSDRKLYQSELDAYRQTMREYSPIPNGESFDLP